MGEGLPDHSGEGRQVGWGERGLQSTQQGEKMPISALAALGHVPRKELSKTWMGTAGAL